MATEVRSSVSGVETTQFFETGYIVLQAGSTSKILDVEEVSINLSRDLNPYHVASQRDPIDQRPGRTKIDFSFKRAFGDKVLLSMFMRNCKFDLALHNNDDPEHPQVILLTGCRLSQDNIGPVNGGDIVSEDLQGSASGIEFDCNKIVSALQDYCVGCADGGYTSRGNYQDNISASTINGRLS